MSQEPIQHSLFDAEEMPREWEEEWQDMPEFMMDDVRPLQKLTILFQSQDDIDEFEKLTGIKIMRRYKAIWFTKRLGRISGRHLRYSNES